MMKKIAFLLVFIINYALVYSQTNYYVSTSGDDSNSGLSTTTAWSTVQHAVSQLSAGDVLNIMAGTYTGGIDVNVSGTDTNRIIIQNYQDDEVIIDGGTLPEYWYLLNVEDNDYITISGLKFQNYKQNGAMGIRILNSNYISILNNELSDIDYSASPTNTPLISESSQPIIVYGKKPDEAGAIKGLLIKGNTVKDCEPGWSECIAVNGNVDGFVVTENELYNNANIPIVAIGHERECPTPELDQARNGVISRNLVHDNYSTIAVCGGIYVDGAKDIVIEYNTSYKNDYGIEVGCENNGQHTPRPTASNITVRNNLVYENRKTGIYMGGFNYPAYSGKVVDSKIINNTCYDNDTGDNYTGELTFSAVENSIVENNIFYANNANNVIMYSSVENATLSFDYNVYYSPSGEFNVTFGTGPTTGYYSYQSYVTTTGRDQNSVFADPLYNSTTSGSLDFDLAQGSPAINKGNPAFTASSGETDFDGESRVVGSKVDCGAYEFNSVVLNTRTVKKILTGAYPNPTSGKIILSDAYASLPYQVATVSGKIVSQGKVVNNQVDLSELAVGIYILKIKTSNTNKFLKVIKK